MERPEGKQSALKTNFCSTGNSITVYDLLTNSAPESIYLHLT